MRYIFVRILLHLLTFFVFGPGAAKAAPGASLSLGISRRTLRGVSGARLTLLRHNQTALRPRDIKTFKLAPGKQEKVGEIIGYFAYMTLY